MTSLVQQIFNMSDKINNGRTPMQIALHAVSELGELAEEVLIAEGKHYKKQGSDGVVGEALDVIQCILDMLRVMYPDITEVDLLRVSELKLEKWKTCVESNPSTYQVSKG